MYWVLSTDWGGFIPAVISRSLLSREEALNLLEQVNEAEWSGQEDGILLDRYNGPEDEAALLGGVGGARLPTDGKVWIHSDATEETRALIRGAVRG